jgi:hypothetical protein
VPNNANLGQVSAKKKWHVNLYACQKEKRIITTHRIHHPSGFQNQIIVKLILVIELQNYGITMAPYNIMISVL